MTTATIRLTIAVAALMSLAPAATRAEEPLPAAYERMMFPDAGFRPHFQAPVWADFTAGPNTWGNVIGTPGYRPLDLEIQWYDVEPDAKDLNKDPLWQVISVVEVPEIDLFTTQSWGLTVAGSAEHIDQAVDNQVTRLIDIELYYRRDPYLQVVVPTYAYIWVVNTGPQYAEWDWIPATEYFEFMDLLDQRYSEGWRPYDIEFAVAEKEWKNRKGDTLSEKYVVGTALLARNWGVVVDTDGNNEYPVPFVPTIWKWFDPWSEPLLYDEQYADWQLLDIEVPPEIDEEDSLLFGYGQGRYFSMLRHRRARFGIFVNTEYVQTEETRTLMGIETTGDVLHDVSGKSQGQQRLIDVEIDGYGKKGEKFVEMWPLYTHVWLLPED